MKRVQGVSFYLLFLLTICLSLKPDSRESHSYVYLHDAHTNIIDWVQALAEIDDDANSPVHALKNYIIEGEKIALHSEIMRVVGYAQWLLAYKCSFDDGDTRYQRLVSVTNNVMNALNYNIVTLDPIIIESVQLGDDVSIESMFRRDVATNIFLQNSQDRSTGNFIKKDANGAGRRFIHNFGIRNTFAGINAGNFSLTARAVDTTGIGADALRFVTSGARNTAVGKDAARENRTGDNNVAIGYNALKNSKTNSFNAAIGDSALVNVNSNATSLENVAIGRNALRGLTDGTSNVAIGSLAGNSSNSGGYKGARSVFVGSGAGNSTNPGSDNIYIGDGAGSLASARNSNIYIGHKGARESTTIRIGIPFNASTNEGQQRCFIAGIRDISSSTNNAVPLFVNAQGQLGVMASSRRFKKNINQMGDESNVVYSLRPVSFVYKNDAMATKQYGLIAEEVDQHFPHLVVKNDDGTPYTVRYDVLPVLLLNEMQKHQYTMQNNKNNREKQQRALQKQERETEKQQQDIEKHQQRIHIKNLNIQEQRHVINTMLFMVNDLQKEIHSYMKK